LTQTVKHRYKAYGAVRQLYRIREWPRGMVQVLLEGAAGTGKTRGLLEWVHWMCDEFPGIRVLFLRHTKDSLAESVLDTWENHCLWPGHPCITGTAQATHRQSYTFPNTSHIVLGGMKDKAQIEKSFSTQFDIVIYFEARQCPDVATWQWLARSNRNWKMPWQIRIADTNPGPTFHWLNQYFPKPETGGCFHAIPKKFHKNPPFTVTCPDLHVNVIPRPETLEQDEKGHLTIPCPTCGGKAQGATMFRLMSKFKDNPVWWNHEEQKYTQDGLEYVEGNLALLTGAPRANLYEGRWAAEEGVVYEDWDADVHVIDEDKAPDRYDWHFAAFDKGLRHPGCLQVWGVVGDSMWRVRELYRTEQNIDFWAEQAVAYQKEFDLQAIVCDPSEPEYIDRFNSQMGEALGRDGERIARRANNAILTGIDSVRYGLSSRNDGPRIHIVRGSLVGKDPARVAKMKPTCLEEEIVAYIWAAADAGKRQVEKPDPTCADHACDNLRYASMFLFGQDLSPHRGKKSFRAETLGAQLDHNAVLEFDAKRGL